MFKFNPQLPVGRRYHGIDYEHVNMLKIQMFETRQMGKVVQDRENILNPSPVKLGGVASHQTQIATYISN